MATVVLMVFWSVLGLLAMLATWITTTFDPPAAGWPLTIAVACIGLAAWGAYDLKWLT